MDHHVITVFSALNYYFYFKFLYCLSPPPPPSTFRLNINEDDHGGTVYVRLISDINECPENTHNWSKGKVTCENTAMPKSA